MIGEYEKWFMVGFMPVAGVICAIFFGVFLGLVFGVPWWEVLPWSSSEEEKEEEENDFS